VALADDPEGADIAGAGGAELFAEKTIFERDAVFESTMFEPIRN